MKPEIYQDFPEVKGKTVELVELSSEAGHYAITVRFEDKTALTFALEQSLIAFPVYSDWTDGEEKKLKEYEPIRSQVSPETEAGLKES
jgi:hypothetical protein